jgi:hypothetical protein
MATYIIKINKNWECLLHSQKWFAFIIM